MFKNTRDYIVLQNCVPNASVSCTDSFIANLDELPNTKKLIYEALETMWPRTIFRCTIMIEMSRNPRLALNS